MAEISVIVPCYNNAQELSKCMESLLNQTMKVDIIIVNDGSTDDTRQVAERYAAEHGQVRVLNKENGSLPQARKSGLSMVRTPYVGFADSDDWVEPNMFETLYKAVTEHNADIACANLYRDWPDGKVTAGLPRYEEDSLLDPAKAMRTLHREEGVFAAVWNKLYKTELFDGVVFPTGNFMGEDYATTIQLLPKAKKIVMIKERLYHYVMHASSMSRGTFGPSQRQGYRVFKEARKKLLEDYPELRREIGHYHCMRNLVVIVTMGRSRTYDREIGREILTDVRQQLGSFLTASYVRPALKCAALAASVHYRVLGGLYRVMIRVAGREPRI